MSLLADIHLGAVLGMLVAAKYLVYSSPPNSKPILFVLVLTYSFLKLGGEPVVRYLAIMVSGYLCFETCLQAEKIVDYFQDRVSAAADAVASSQLHRRLLPSPEALCEKLAGLWQGASSCRKKVVQKQQHGAKSAAANVQGGDRRDSATPEVIPRGKSHGAGTKTDPPLKQNHHSVVYG